MILYGLVQAKIFNCRKAVVMDLILLITDRFSLLTSSQRVKFHYHFSHLIYVKFYEMKNMKFLRQLIDNDLHKNSKSFYKKAGKSKLSIFIKIILLLLNSVSTVIISNFTQSYFLKVNYIFH